MTAQRAQDSAGAPVLVPAGATAAPRAQTVGGVLRDFVTLTKPRLTSLVLCTTAGGLWLAPHPSAFVDHSRAWLVLTTLLGTALVVGGANAMNMFFERDIDGLMRRTRNRPLPTGRLSPATVLGFGIALPAVGVPLLALGVNRMTGLLGLAAYVLYVWVYTPLKRVTWWALVAGAVPGAIPPLLGWTAATASIAPPGLALFAILFLWQLPHFAAIALYAESDYKAAGIKTLAGERGIGAVKIHSLCWIALLIPTSLSLVPLHVAGAAYTVTALVLGAAFLGGALYGLRPSAGVAWGRGMFRASLLYLTLLFVVLMATGGAR